MKLTNSSGVNEYKSWGTGRSISRARSIRGEVGRWGGPFDDLVILILCTKLVKGGEVGLVCHRSQKGDTWYICERTLSALPSRWYLTTERDTNLLSIVFLVNFYFFPQLKNNNNCGQLPRSSLMVMPTHYNNLYFSQGWQDNINDHNSQKFPSSPPCIESAVCKQFPWKLPIPHFSKPELILDRSTLSL